MSEPVNEPTPEGEEPNEQEQPDEGVEDNDDPRLAKVRNEAKNLRSRLRDAEAERDGLRASLNTYNRIDASQIAAEYLTDGEDLFRGGVELADLLGEDGTVDDDLVQEAARRVAAEHPNWTPNRAISALRPGMPESGPTKTWQQLLQSKKS